MLKLTGLACLALTHHAHAGRKDNGYGYNDKFSSYGGYGDTYHSTGYDDVKDYKDDYPPNLPKGPPAYDDYGKRKPEYHSGKYGKPDHYGPTGFEYDNHYEKHDHDSYGNDNKKGGYDKMDKKDDNDQKDGYGDYDYHHDGYDKQKPHKPGHYGPPGYENDNHYGKHDHHNGYGEKTSRNHGKDYDSYGNDYDKKDGYGDYDYHHDGYDKQKPHKPDHYGPPGYEKDNHYDYDKRGHDSYGNDYDKKKGGYDDYDYHHDGYTKQKLSHKMYGPPKPFKNDKHLSHGWGYKNNDKYDGGKEYGYENDNYDKKDSYEEYDYKYHDGYAKQKPPHMSYGPPKPFKNDKHLSHGWGYKNNDKYDEGGKDYGNYY